MGLTVPLSLTLTPPLTQVREQGLQASIEMQKREAALSLQLEARDAQLEAMQGHAQVCSLVITPMRDAQLEAMQGHAQQAAEASSPWR